METEWKTLSPYDKLVRTDQIEPRTYQINIIKGTISGRNTLVILPTGLGKTLIGIFAIAKALYSGKKALILAPTRPLSDQHYQSMLRLLNIENDLILLLTGSISAKKREALVNHAKVVAATPQTIANDLRDGRISIEDFGVVIFDECHRTVGRYAYTYIADQSKENKVQLIGLTASPGSDRKKIADLISTLGIRNIEIRTNSDSDVAPYVMAKETETLYINKGPNVDAIASILKPIINTHLERLFKTGLSAFRHFENMPKSKLLEIGKNIDALNAKNYKFAALYDYIYVLNLSHAYDLICSEGIYPFVKYFESLEEREKKSKSIKSILSNQEIRKAIDIAREALKRGEEHPKMLEIISVIKDQFSDKSVIIFAQYRSTIKKLAEMLNQNGISAKPFVGRGEGITQEKQKSIIEDFRAGNFRVLVATSIGEEGLDIPAVDAVIFYEPIPSEIRNIQRRGRAGRIKFGKVVVAVAIGTKDEMYLAVSKNREKKMIDLILKIKERMEMGGYDLPLSRTRSRKIGTQTSLYP